MSATMTVGFYICSDVERQGPGYLSLRRQSRKKTFWAMSVHTGFLKITIFSIRVERMGSMETRRRLPLSLRSKWFLGRGNGRSLAHNCHLQERGWAPGAGEAEVRGGAAAAGELPRAGKGSSKHLLAFHLVRCSMETTDSSSSICRLCQIFWPPSCPLSFLAVPAPACWEMCTPCWVKAACVFLLSSWTPTQTADITCHSDLKLQSVHVHVMQDVLLFII